MEAKLLFVFVVFAILQQSVAVTCGDGQYSCGLLDMSCCSCSSWAPNCMHCSALDSCCSACASGWSGCKCDVPANFGDYCDDTISTCACFPYTHPLEVCPGSTKSDDDVSNGLLAVPKGMFNISAFTVASDLTLANSKNVQWWLLQNGPVVISMCVGSLFNPKQSEGFFGFFQSILTCSDCNGNPNHAVTLVGWAQMSGASVWIIQNSWGTSSGDSGFFYIRFEDVGTGPGQFNILQIAGLYVTADPGASISTTRVYPPYSWIPPSQFNQASTGTFGNSSMTCASRLLNQQNCGSCYAFASTAVLATTLCKTTGLEEYLMISPQFTLGLQYFETSINPCQGGYPMDTLQYLATNFNGNMGTCGKECADGCLPYTEGGCLEPTSFAATGSAAQIKHIAGYKTEAVNRSDIQHLDTSSGRLDKSTMMQTKFKTGQQQSVTLTSLEADTATKNFLNSWQEKLAVPSQHRLRQVYSLTKQVTNGLLYRIRVSMTKATPDAELNYHVHSTLHYGPHPTNDNVGWSLRQYSTDLSEHHFLKNSV